VWAPESAVMSRAVRFLEAKREMRDERLAVGGGRLAFAALMLADVVSLLPSGTVHVGPPNYNSNKVIYAFQLRV